MHMHVYAYKRIHVFQQGVYVYKLIKLRIYMFVYTHVYSLMYVYAYFYYSRHIYYVSMYYICMHQEPYSKLAFYRMYICINGLLKWIVFRNWLWDKNSCLPKLSYWAADVCMYMII